LLVPPPPPQPRPVLIGIPAFLWKGKPAFFFIVSWKTLTFCSFLFFVYRRLSVYPVRALSLFPKAVSRIASLFSFEVACPLVLSLPDIVSSFTLKKFSVLPLYLETVLHFPVSARRADPPLPHFLQFLLIPIVVSESS